MLDSFRWIGRRLGNSAINYHLLESMADQSEKSDGSNSSELDFEGEYNEPRPVIQQHRWSLVIRRYLMKLTVLLPSFLHPSNPDTPPKNSHKTAWLDGLRGVAAFFVVWHHMSLVWFSWSIHNGWTSIADPFIRLPIIRLSISGLPNVMVFFVISGYALSYKPLSLLRRDRVPEAHRALASSMFRRHPRLFAPAVILCVPCVLLAYAGVYGDGARMPGAAVAALDPPRRGTVWEQLLDYGGAVARLCDPFSGDATGWVYNNALWTLPIEFRSSLVVFGLLLALSGVGNGVRMFAVSGVALYCVCFVHWAEFLFVGGMLLADLQFCFSERNGYDEPRIRQRSLRRCGAGRRIIRNIVTLASFLGALYLLGMPKLERGASDTPGFRGLASLIPERWRAAGSANHFWLSLAAVWLVFTVDRSPLLQRMFTCRFAQYLGRISYSLYLVHLVILHTLGFRIGKIFVELIGSDTGWGYFIAILATSISFWFVTIWVADLGWRFVDAKVVRALSWAYNQLCNKEVIS
ncbi:acyltransferase family-domain-containing protein [Annulohypoxylon bovei var. microspora]|nr:acyltransferase family-domain-containing protein [Annulohypoxylon bovei var. microspora]